MSKKFSFGFWERFKEKHQTTAQFVVFFLLSNAVTVLQILLMPLLKEMFAQTALVDTNFQAFPIGQNFDGSQYYIFNYAAGSLTENGGGGLAYFLAVQISLLVAQVINFFLQRNVTFKSKSNPWIAAGWYLIAYICITFIAGALQGLYKAPIYTLLIDTWGWGKTGETVADVITMIINAAISFWVFFPIFRWIFKDKKGKDAPVENQADQ